MANYAARHSIPPGVRAGIGIRIGLGGVGNVGAFQQSQGAAPGTAFAPHKAGDIACAGAAGTGVKNTSEVLEKLLSMTQANLLSVIEQIRANPNDDNLLDQEHRLAATLRQLLRQIATRE